MLWNHVPKELKLSKDQGQESDVSDVVIISTGVYLNPCSQGPVT